MKNTKDKILVTALRLFAQDGYEAVSVSKIAGELGITKGALYKHYKNKRDIFDSIFEYLCQLDEQRAKSAKVPEKTFEEMPLSFGKTSVDGIVTYLKEQFLYWSEDEMACNFRKMLTLEQYRNPEMTALYHKVMTQGPIDYIENLIREMMKQGTWREGNPKQMAIELHAPFYLLLSISDSTQSAEEKREIANAFMAQVDQFVKKNATQKHMAQKEDVKT